MAYRVQSSSVDPIVNLNVPRDSVTVPIEPSPSRKPSIHSIILSLKCDIDWSSVVLARDMLSATLLLSILSLIKAEYTPDGATEKPNIDRLFSAISLVDIFLVE